MSYTTEQLEADVKEKAARLHERNREVWEQILNTTDQSEGKAFFDTLVRWCGGELSSEKYDVLCLCPTALQVSPGFESKDWHRGTLEFYQQKAWNALREQGWNDERVRDDARNTAGKHLRDMTKPEVRAYIREIGFRSTVKSAEDARAYLAKHRLLQSQKAYWTSDGQGPYARLPRMVVPPGFVNAIPRDAKYYRLIAETEAIQRDMQRYSSEQVTARIQDTLDSLRQN